MTTQPVETWFSLDWPNLLVGFVFGFLANAAWAYYSGSRARVQLRKKYGGIAGEYTAYLYLHDSDQLNYIAPSGRDKITYEKDNILKIVHQETAGDHVWEGTVYMDNPTYGSITWKYIRLSGNQPPREHRFGFKRCVITEGFGRNGEPRKYFYLIGEPPFGQEILEKT